MRSLSAFEAQQSPLTSDTEIEIRVQQLIGRACLRQLWVLFLDPRDIQLPLLIPLADYPSSPPPGSVSNLSRVVRHCVDEAQAAKVVLVWERRQGALLTDTDKAWAKVAVAACVEAGVPLRAQLVSHSSGIKWLAPDDCL